MDLVYVKNLDPTSLKLAHDAQGDVVIAPGERKILPVDYINVYFGNPAARDDGKHKARTETYKRIQVMWGFYAGMEPDEAWEERRPKFEVTTLEGERVWTVMEDPAGVKQSAELSDEVPDDPRFVNAKLAELSAQVERLTALLANQQAGGGVAPERPTAESVVAAQVADHLERLTGDRSDDDSTDVAGIDSGAIPPPNDDEPPVKKDAPRTPRSGGRVKGSGS